MWILFHPARIEDIRMSLLVAGTPQISLRDGWMERLNILRIKNACTQGRLMAQLPEKDNPPRLKR